MKPNVGVKLFNNTEWIGENFATRQVMSLLAQNVTLFSQSEKAISEIIVPTLDNNFSTRYQDVLNYFKSYAKIPKYGIIPTKAITYLDNSKVEGNEKGITPRLNPATFEPKSSE